MKNFYIQCVVCGGFNITIRTDIKRRRFLVECKECGVAEVIKAEVV